MMPRDFRAQFLSTGTPGSSEDRWLRVPSMGVHGDSDTEFETCSRWHPLGRCRSPGAVVHEPPREVDPRGLIFHATRSGAPGSGRGQSILRGIADKMSA